MGWHLTPLCFMMRMSLIFLFCMGSTILPMLGFLSVIHSSFLTRESAITLWNGAVLRFSGWPEFACIFLANEECSSPTNQFELFNLQHASGRNVIERIFGVLKWRFKILIYPPEISMDLQARLPAALAAIHNFIRDLDPADLSDFQEVVDPQPGWHSGDLADGLPAHAERDRANNRRDVIAGAMWVQYQQHLAAGRP